MVTAKPIELTFRCFPNIINYPNKICATATIDKEKIGKGTSLAITTSKFAEKRNTFAIPGSKKYIPINILPTEKRLKDISVSFN